MGRVPGCADPTDAVDGDTDPPEARAPHDYQSFPRLVHEITTTLDAPDDPGDYVILYRFRDVSTADPDRQVHIDLPITGRVGDASTQRWAFYGYLTVESP